MSRSADPVTMIEIPIIRHTMNLGLFASLFLLITFSNPLMVFLSKVSLFGLLFIYVGFLLEMKKRLKQTFLILIVMLGAALFIIPINPIYTGLEDHVIVPYIGPATFQFYDFGFLFFILFLESTFAYIITIWYYKRHKQTIVEGQSDDALDPIFFYFLKGTEPRKIFTLIVMLVAAAFYEEIIYRFFLFNIILSLGIPFVVGLIIAGFVFGYAHKGNGYVGYIFSSVVSGMVFCWALYQFGVPSSFLLHLAWNGLVVFEDYISMWAASKMTLGKHTNSKIVKFFSTR